ncbi:MAG: hypothetical protein IJ542_00150 [Clostridia bacterium]|nr:hypothetical protein [Clostridia bacterium]
MEWIIYKHTNKINGKVYIGQTKQTPTQRWRNGNGYKNNVYFYHSIQKYGWNNFVHEILEKGINSVKQANEKEVYYITKYDSYKNGYNLTSGGDNRDHLGIPVLQIDINSLEIVNAYQTIRYAEETTGIDHSQISRCCLKNKKDIQAGGYYWCFQDEWHDGWNPKKRTPPAAYNKKEIYQLDKSMNIVCKFESILDAEKATGIKNSSIGQCCRSKRISAGNYYWCYIEDYDSFIPLLPLDERPVVRINNNNYEEIVVYNNISEAANKNNISSPELISRCCNGKQISTGGYYWCYQEDYSLDWKPRKNGNFTKVQCVETGIIYNSIKEAIEKTSASSAIKRCLKHPELKSGGYHWKHVED